MRETTNQEFTFVFPLGRSVYTRSSLFRFHPAGNRRMYVR